jgi:hypothetical protein
MDGKIVYEFSDETQAKGRREELLMSLYAI